MNEVSLLFTSKNALGLLQKILQAQPSSLN